MSLYKYTSDTVLQEADLIIAGNKLREVSALLKIPISTVSWHMLNSLKQLDLTRYEKVRVRLAHLQYNRKDG